MTIFFAFHPFLDSLTYIFCAKFKSETCWDILYILLGRWSHEYNRLVKRFRNTIAGQFFGHTHLDEFEVFFKDLEPISMAYLAPSQTPWMDQGLNPAYRIYIIDGSTHPFSYFSWFHMKLIVIDTLI